MSLFIFFFFFNSDETWNVSSTSFILFSLLVSHVRMDSYLASCDINSRTPRKSVTSRKASADLPDGTTLLETQVAGHAFDPEKHKIGKYPPGKLRSHSLKFCFQPLLFRFLSLNRFALINETFQGISNRWLIRYLNFWLRFIERTKWQSFQTHGKTDSERERNQILSEPSNIKRSNWCGNIAVHTHVLWDQGDEDVR